jgi:hypothetical protein
MNIKLVRIEKHSVAEVCPFAGKENNFAPCEKRGTILIESAGVCFMVCEEHSVHYFKFPGLFHQMDASGFPDLDGYIPVKRSDGEKLLTQCMKQGGPSNG